MRNVILLFVCFVSSISIQSKDIEYLFNDLFTISVSDKMELRQDDDLYTQFQNQVLNYNTDSDIVFQQRNLGKMQNSAHSYYCRILIKILEEEEDEFPNCDYSDYSQDDLDELINLAKEFIEKDKEEILAVNPNFNPEEYGFVTEPTVTVESNSNGVVYVKIHYVRTGLEGNGNVVVDLCFFFNNRYSLICFFSYREFEEGIWKPVLSKAKNSIEWTHPYKSLLTSSSQKGLDNESKESLNSNTSQNIYWLLIIIPIVIIGLAYFLKKNKNKTGKVITLLNDETSDKLKIGTKLKNGRYVIQRYIASGGFGNTYEVLDKFTSKKCAIKEFYLKNVVQRDNKNSCIFVSNPLNNRIYDNSKEKFRKEAQRLSRFDNPHIVHVNDLFDENNTVYYVMDFIEGNSLSDRMKKQNRTFNESECVNILYQLIPALKEIHNAGLLHMDIKPNNIMIDKKGTCILIDFGASKQIEQHDGSTTTSSLAAYTPGYAPIEQATGNKANWGSWTDLYAVGATLYNLISGKRPPLHDELLDNKDELFNFNLTVSPEFVNLLKCLLNPQRSFRPQNVDELERIMMANNIVKE